MEFLVTLFDKENDDNISEDLVKAASVEEAAFELIPGYLEKDEIQVIHSSTREVITFMTNDQVYTALCIPIRNVSEYVQNYKRDIWTFNKKTEKWEKQD